MTASKNLAGEFHNLDIAFSSSLVNPETGVSGAEEVSLKPGEENSPCLNGDGVTRYRAHNCGSRLCKHELGFVDDFVEAL